MTVPGSSVGVDQLPTLSVYLEPTRAGWCLRAGDVIVAGGWESAEAAVVKAAHVDAVAYKALSSHTGVPPRNPGSPGVPWPLPTVSVATLLADLDAALAEHVEVASTWWHAHGVALVEGESPWLLAVSDVTVPATRGRNVGEVRALHGLGATAFLLGTLTGRFPSSVIVACPDAGDRHQVKNGGTGQLSDYWPAALRGVKAKAAAPYGRHAFTVGGVAAAAYVAVHGLTLPLRTLTAPMVVPAGVRATDGVDPHQYVARAVPAKDVETPVPAAVSRPRKTTVPAGTTSPTPTVTAVVNNAAVAARAATVQYVAALRQHVLGALAGTSQPTLVDVIQACAVATVAVPTPAGAVDLDGGTLAGLVITRGNVAPALNVPGVVDAITALTNP